MELKTHNEGDALVACIGGKIDTVSAQDFDREMAALAGQAPKLLILDLAGLEYISSAGLRVILSTAKTLKAGGGEVRLAGTAGSVHKVFQISGFFNMFKNFASREDALAAES